LELAPGMPGDSISQRQSGGIRPIEVETLRLAQARRGGPARSRAPARIARTPSSHKKKRRASRAPHDITATPAGRQQVLDERLNVTCIPHRDPQLTAKCNRTWSAACYSRGPSPGRQPLDPDLSAQYRPASSGAVAYCTCCSRTQLPAPTQPAHKRFAQPSSLSWIPFPLSTWQLTHLTIVTAQPHVKRNRRFPPRVAAEPMPGRLGADQHPTLSRLHGPPLTAGPGSKRRTRLTALKPRFGLTPHGRTLK
jgi:hypothetical protein